MLKVEMLRAQVKELKGAPADQVVRVSLTSNLIHHQADELAGGCQAETG